MTWTLDDHIARVRTAGWNIQSDLSQPTKGWSIARDDCESFDGLLAVKSSVAMSPLEEAYVREGELAARYPQTTQPGIGLDLRYRICSASVDRVVIQMTCAIQTRQFEAYPTLGFAVPKLAADQIGTINIWDEPNYPGALVMVPSDVAQSQLSAGNPSDSVDLFGDFLERGVIRKCRMRLMLGTSGCSDLQCEQELDALASQPLPLLA